MSKKFAEWLASFPEVEPDEIDRAMLAEIDSNPNPEYITQEEYEKQLRLRNGKISLRIPRELHHILAENAKEQGVSLNQYCLYKLSQQTVSR